MSGPNDINTPYPNTINSWMEWAGTNLTFFNIFNVISLQIM